ncbi:hypothetical protein F5B22DRAFT_150776 [Xylaria bambusicola]|uniref:uncharacterized protein n=1 Tax=Xylaria bambusicola TaxID=326684 RepID=UPI002007BB02|nr:uncharacterized protein F5B22DRAFT_150776 [Xylaria bambusicola]KAI0526282.1 hypothetical protein F5B22DRAFT_150776 [Xylaria bambusicola]
MQSGGENDGLGLRYLLCQYPIRSCIFRYLDTRSILNLCRTSSAFRGDIYSYLWDINEKLERFFRNPTAFRTALGRADGLIAGSFALQFFANRFWPESDLDINLRDGEGVEILGKYLVEAEGYEMVRNQDLEVIDYDQFIRLRDIEKIITFAKSRDGNGSSPELKVQLVATKNHPIVAILGTYYTSCIVNFISWNKAYCIFPRATLLYGETVPLTEPCDYDVALHNKYSKRGWRVRTRSVNFKPGSANLLRGDLHPLGTCLNVDRRIGGSDTWTMKLGTAGVAPPPQPDSVLDYSSFSLWVTGGVQLDDPLADGCRVTINIEIFKSPSLRYQHTYGSLRPFWSFVGDVLVGNLHGQLKTKMIRSTAESIISTSWRVWDCEFVKPDGWDYWDDWIPEAFEAFNATS